MLLLLALAKSKSTAATKIHRSIFENSTFPSCLRLPYCLPLPAVWTFCFWLFCHAVSGDDEITTIQTPFSINF